MAVDWGDIGNLALGVALPGVGGLLGSLTDQITTLFGGSSIEEQQQQAIDQAYKSAIAYGPQSTGASMFNAAGNTGKAEVKSAFDLAMGKAGVADAQTSSLANRMMGIAKDMPGASMQFSQAAIKQGNQMLGKNLNNAYSTAKAMGGGPAALAGIGSKVGQASGDALGNIYQNAGQQYLQSMAQSAGITGQAAGVREQGIQRRYQQEVVPYMAQVNPSAVQPGAAGDIARSARQDAMVQQPMAGFEAGLGQIGGGLLATTMRNFLPQSQPPQTPTWPQIPQGDLSGDMLRVQGNPMNPMSRPLPNAYGLFGPNQGLFGGRS